ncbi:C-type lectin lectoxin-Lio2-like [Pecten maximus]|uniref:C-type lectin lectoxin-Lio2-like n=1 Tax=Pecten maximus TaxID=6579 RepID=UPI0014582B58|nr:C-type lectin lectoxin-Lio2-like [Pecten maximus]
MDAGLCFEMFEKKLTWHDAKTKCEEEEGRLVVLKNSKQTETLMNLEQGNLYRKVWIGLTVHGKNSIWKWLDGTTFNSSIWSLIDFNGESSTYPEEVNTADCGSISRIRKYLTDDNFKLASLFVCERPQLL